MAWVFLGIGIVLGSWWAYYELDQGGWWLWNPVENVSFMPWLVGTALIHSLAVTERRGVFKSWTVLLATVASSLSPLDAFLVRSDVPTSVHAFASDPERGVFIPVFLLPVVSGPLTLLTLRAPVVKSQVDFALWSRETLLLLNNLVLVVAASMVLPGTLYPLLLNALSGAKLSVGPPYFNAAFLPLMAALMAALAVGALARWKDTPSRWLFGILTPALVTSAVLAAAGSMHFDDFNWAVLAMFLLSVWVALTGFRDFLDKTWHKDVLVGAHSLTRSYQGMQLVHLGIATCAIGIVLSSQCSAQRNLCMSPGDTVELGSHHLLFSGVKHYEGSNYTLGKGNIHVSRDGEEIATLHPEKRLYTVQSSMMTEAGIDAGFTHDPCVALGEPLENSIWAVCVHAKPFARWIWFGGLLMGLGGALVALDWRYRVKVKTRMHEALGLADQGA